MKWMVMSMLVLIFAGCNPQMTGVSSSAIGETKVAGMGDVIYGFGVTYYTSSALKDKWELTYTGMSGDIVKVQYKEYTKVNNGWIIKDAFSQLLEYDLSKSKLITFKGFSCEVLEANGPQLAFKVLTIPEVKTNP